MKPSSSFLHSLFIPFLLTFFTSASLSAQEKPQLGSIAVLRMKNVAPTNENSNILKDFAAKTNAALAAIALFQVPPEVTVAEAIDDEGVNLDGLIDLEEYLAVGKSLKTDFIVIGSVTQKVMTLYAHTRIYSVADGSLKAVVGSELSVERVPDLINLLAQRIGAAMGHPTPPDTAYASFQWSQDFRFAFGTDRLDLTPPVVHFVNQDPPFEIAVKADMDRLQGGYVVTNFDIFADNEPIASVNPQMEPPRLLRETEVLINGHEFCFRADLKEMRGPRGRAITGALITITARYCR